MVHQREKQKPESGILFWFLYQEKKKDKISTSDCKSHFSFFLFLIAGNNIVQCSFLCT